MMLTHRRAKHNGFLTTMGSAGTRPHVSLSISLTNNGRQIMGSAGTRTFLTYPRTKHMGSLRDPASCVIVHLINNQRAINNGFLRNPGGVNVSPSYRQWVPPGPGRCTRIIGLRICGPYGTRTMLTHRRATNIGSLWDTGVVAKSVDLKPAAVADCGGRRSSRR